MRSERGTLPLALALLAGALGACVPRVDTAADERAIRDLDKQWVQAVASKDTMTIGNFYAEDGQALYPNQPRVTGRAAVRSLWSKMLKAPNLTMTFEPTLVTVSSAGDIAYETGTYKLGYDGPKGRVEDAGKYVVTWKKVNGAWKVQHDTFNSDKPGM